MKSLEITLSTKTITYYPINLDNFNNSKPYIWYTLIQSRSSELFGIRLRLPVLLTRSLTTKFLHLRSTKTKMRTWDPVPTLTMRTRTSEVSVENINYKSNLFLTTFVTSDINIICI